MKRALLIIDVQNIMFSYEDGVTKGDLVVDNILTLLTQAREKSVSVIFIQHTNEEGSFKIGNLDREIHSKITPIKGETIISKYSWDSFLNTSLEEELKKQKIEQLVISGMQTEYCIDTTVRRAYSLGFMNNIVISDGHSTFDTETLKGFEIINHHNNIWGGRFAELKKTDEIEF